MQQALLGSARFRDGMDLYFERHDGEAVTCDDFVSSMQDASGVDLVQFRHWYAQAGTPVVTVRGSYDAPARTYAIDVEQALPSRTGSRRRPPLHLPLALGLVGPDGADMPLRLAGEGQSAATTRVVEITTNAQRFEFVDVAKAPVPSLLRGFSAPVRVVFDYDDDSLALLASHDSDAVNRWDAMQRLYINAILGLALAHRDEMPLALPPVLTRAVSHLLRDRTSDPSLLSLALALPDTAYVAALEQRIDPDAIVAAVVYVERSLAMSLRDEFVAAYRHFRPNAAYEWTPKQTGLRSMSNRCLRYLGALDDVNTDSLVTEQFESSDNMTDSIGALAALRDASSSARNTLYARFEARWSDDPLVLDKWFELQAQSTRDDTLDVVRALLTHPRFNLRNPNRVRSLVGAFTLRNFARFHAGDGKGYAFAAEQVRALDPINPQLAAAVAGAFNLWRRFEEPRRSQMLESLERIARGRALSPDVAEVVTRTLAL
jgi:aminopeptidase N